MMSSRIKRHAALLKVLCKAKPKAVKAILSSEKELVDALCECSLNVLKGVVPLSVHQRKRLSRYKNNLRTVAKKTVSRQQKKALFQKGGFLSALLTPIINVLGTLLGN